MSPKRQYPPTRQHGATTKTSAYFSRPTCQMLGACPEVLGYDSDTKRCSLRARQEHVLEAQTRCFSSCETWQNLPVTCVPWRLLANCTSHAGIGRLDLQQWKSDLCYSFVTCALFNDIVSNSCYLASTETDLELGGG
jgi:hypothetical protein